MKIYFAGPLFTAAEVDFNNTVATRLRHYGHEVFLPQEMEQRQIEAREIFDADVEGIDWADAVLANMDGADPDSGTCWECGYSYGKKKIVVYRTDTRQEEYPFGPYNLMLWCSATEIVDCRDMTAGEVANKLAEVLHAL